MPIVLYSLKKSYPQYTPIIYLHKNLREDVKEKLSDIVSLDKFVIKENNYEYLKGLSNQRGKALRWVIRDKKLKDFDYVYFIDIDILYFREPIPLHAQHKKHMKILDLPFSNVIRTKVNNNRKPKTFLYRVKNYGLTNAILNFMKGKRTEKRLSGLHFVEVKRYFEKVEMMQKKYRKILTDENRLKNIEALSNEGILYEICKKSGFDLNKLGEYYEDPVSANNFNNFEKRNFRPHHGIHLGLFRGNDTNVPTSKIIADSNTYDYYIKNIDRYLDDKIFIRLLNNSDDFIKKQFDSMFQYYSISNPI